MNDKLLQELDWRLHVFDSLSFPTLILKPDKVILTANKSFCSVSGSSWNISSANTAMKYFMGPTTALTKSAPFPRF
jgi:hypothetical protein